MSEIIFSTPRPASRDNSKPKLYFQLRLGQSNILTRLGLGVVTLLTGGDPVFIEPVCSSGTGEAEPDGGIDSFMMVGGSVTIASATVEYVSVDPATACTGTQKVVATSPSSHVSANLGELCSPMSDLKYI